MQEFKDQMDYRYLQMYYQWHSQGCKGAPPPQSLQKPFSQVQIHREIGGGGIHVTFSKLKLTKCQPRTTNNNNLLKELDVYNLVKVFIYIMVARRRYRVSLRRNIHAMPMTCIHACMPFNMKSNAILRM